MSETLTAITSDGLTTVFGVGFMLSVAGWALGFKIGVALSVIKKL